MTFVIMNGQTLIVMQSTLITSIISIVFRLPHSGAVFLFPKLTDGKNPKIFSGVEISRRLRAEFSG
ncbi:hypothetical protein J9P64_003906 [Salmonella enterica]|nr:hypothetical protein [Salmonella enterica subsp. enterica serovar Newport]EHI4808894.1 hypothetical protein [Salmonella enterica]EIY1731251.1 hypothetical protein [Salmonella enterica subsp. enterica serovar Newport]HAK0225057.1 hypothetical protein [Salmonella enterica]HAK6562385.1 hypothetical protein [Salmonella enterica]